MQRFSLLPDAGAFIDLPVLGLNVEPHAVLSEFGPVDCLQTLAPVSDALEHAGHALVETPGADYALTLILSSRHRALTRGWLAEAWAATREGGTIALSGAKTDGVDAVVKDLKKAGLAPDVQAKAHGKLAVLTRTGETPAIFATWAAALEPAPNRDGYLTSPGVFSHDHADAGSVLLAETFGPAIKGRVMDLGAGWGYLSARLLESGADVTELHLVEADRLALDLAKKNVTDRRATFHWADATRPETLPGPMDTLIMNPPFHSGRAGEPALGQAFIRTAAATLKPRGDLWLVANRHLPYEKALGEAFRTVREVKATSGFKIIRAEHPFRSQSARQSASLQRRAP